MVTQVATMDDRLRDAGHRERCAMGSAVPLPRFRTPRCNKPQASARSTVRSCTLDQMTQQKAPMVEQSAAAAEGMREQAARLAQAGGTVRLHQA